MGEGIEVVLDAQYFLLYDPLKPSP
ncbi:uncharacterized protein CPUR_08029 [Claviceps purpurea 20.1]|uniref:Uncharacterized protein n=1 Tax=Claviceps purpurea (strain 20.1) TaxID=1111077 RepID=M1VYJ2_CLAP2|nr:uncharacterized protein CPUR_08029 [Claviceps purpurea 20.1]